MLIHIFKSKIHRATVTQANLNYVGSVTIDETLMEAANLLEGEKEERALFILLISVSGIGVNTARVILSYMTPEEARDFKPSVVFPDEHNRIPV